MADVHMSDGDVTMGDAELERLVYTAKTWPTKAFDLFRTLLQNVVSNPDDAKFRKLKLSNARISALLAETGALEGFQTLGWVMSGDALELPSSKDLGNLDFVLKGTDCGPPGDLVSLTVLRGALKSKIELPSNTLFSALASKIEESDALGRIPRQRQRLLIGVPPKPLEQAFPLFASMTISQLGLKAFKLEDAWEEMVADLRALRASFESLASVLSCKKTLQDNFDFLLDSAKALLKSRAMKMDDAELRMARKCFAILWPPGVEETRLARIEHSAACTPLAVPQKSEDGTTSVPQQFPLQVERADLFNSAVSQIQKASIEELRRPLQVSFVGEAAEDAGGPRREFFNDFGRSCNEHDLWQTTPAGSLTPVGDCSDNSNIFRSCGRIYGLSLCQAENAAQEQRVRENATIQELLAAVTGDDEPQAQQQKLLVGASLARPFLRCVQLDPPESLEELQAELNAENDESSPDFRGSTRFLTSSLAELGLEAQLTFSRERPDGTVVELKPAGNSEIVTDATKLEWLKSTLRSELVESVEEAARNFRVGVCEAAGAAYVVLLSAVELQQDGESAEFGHLKMNLMDNSISEFIYLEQGDLVAGCLSDLISVCI